MTVPADEQRLREATELVGRRLRGLVYMAEKCDPEEGNGLADRAWLLATANDVSDLHDALVAERDAAVREAERLRAALEEANDVIHAEKYDDPEDKLRSLAVIVGMELPAAPRPRAGTRRRSAVA